LQCLQLNLGESPFYAAFGISAQQAVIQQLWPDYDVARTQQQFAPYFAALIISRVPGAQKPTYKVNVTTNTGVKISATVAQ
jgi:HSP20 family molecular chaperone IbpA